MTTPQRADGKMKCWYRVLATEQAKRSLLGLPISPGRIIVLRPPAPTMCISVFISTDLELEAAPFSPGVEHFRVCSLLELEEAVKAYFSKRNVYYVASHEDCGCGFEWDAEDKDEDPAVYEQEWQTMSEKLKEEVGWTPEDQRRWVAARQRTAEDLENLLAGLLQRTDELEIGVFDDSEFRPPWSHRFVAPSDLSHGRPAVFPVVGTLYHVRTDA